MWTLRDWSSLHFVGHQGSASCSLQDLHLPSKGRWLPQDSRAERCMEVSFSYLGHDEDYHLFEPRPSYVWFWVLIPEKQNAVSISLFCHVAVKTGAKIMQTVLWKIFSRLSALHALPWASPPRLPPPCLHRQRPLPHQFLLLVTCFSDSYQVFFYFDEIANLTWVKRELIVTLFQTLCPQLHDSFSTHWTKCPRQFRWLGNNSIIC